MKMKSIDLLLVNPTLDYEGDRKYYESIKIEPNIPRLQPPHIGIGYLLGSAKKAGISAKYVDMIQQEVSVDHLLRLIDKHHPKIIGFTTWTIRINQAGQIAQKIKEKHPDILICAGGSHASALAKQTLEEFKSFDFIVRGEGDKIISQLFDKSDYSKIKGVITRNSTDFSFDRIEDIDALPFPAWEEFDLKIYPGTDPHQTNLELPMSSSRGCFGHCVFCGAPLGRKRIGRSIDSIISEIERDILDFKCEAICFQDDTFIEDPAHTERLMNEIIKRNLNKKIKWSCETRVDIVYPELFKLMKKAGCYYVYIGMESADDQILKNIGKNIVVEQIKHAVSWIKDAGIIPAGSFILGLPGETMETAEKSIYLAKELNLYSTPFPIAVPFPGTPLRKMAEMGKYGLKILTNNWDDYGKQYPGVMESKNLSIDELRELQKKAYEVNPKKEIAQFVKRE